MTLLAWNYNSCIFVVSIPDLHSQFAVHSMEIWRLGMRPISSPHPSILSPTVYRGIRIYYKTRNNSGNVTKGNHSCCNWIHTLCSIFFFFFLEDFSRSGNIWVCGVLSEDSCFRVSAGQCRLLSSLYWGRSDCKGVLQSGKHEGCSKAITNLIFCFTRMTGHCITHCLYMYVLLNVSPYCLLHCFTMHCIALFLRFPLNFNGIHAYITNIYNLATQSHSLQFYSWSKGQVLYGLSWLLIW